MSELHDDSDLKAIFARQRAACSGRVPSFRAMVARAGRDEVDPPKAAASSWDWRWKAIAAVAMVQVLATIFFVWRSGRSTDPSALQVQTGVPPTTHEVLLLQIDHALALLDTQVSGQRPFFIWQSPTDVLLNPSLVETP
ncbi:MAG: hypothetical protein ACT4QC_13240 [Planctomycetaceae bacterium]